MESFKTFLRVCRSVPILSDMKKLQDEIEDLGPTTANKSTQLSRRRKFQRYRKGELYMYKKRNLTQPSCADEESISEDSIFSSESIVYNKIYGEEVEYNKEENALDKLECGTFGKVYKADWHGPVALKKLIVEKPTELQIEMYKNEVTVLRKMRHDHVLGFMGYVSKPYLGIVTQWCDGDTLYERLHVGEDELEMITIVIILKQVSEAMDYLHSQNVHHRDIKSKNIFFYNGLHVKVGDFGLAVMKNLQKNDEKNKRDETDENDEKDETDKKNEKYKKDETNENDGNDENDESIVDGKKNKKVGTKQKPKKKRKTIKAKKDLKKQLENQLVGSIRWIAPEVLRMKEEYPYSFQSDVYSFGILMWELLARDIPYGLNADSLFIIYNVALGCLKPDESKIRSDAPKELIKLYRQCIEFEKEKRPLFSYIARRVYGVFKAISRPHILPDTYVEKANDVQDFITSDVSDYDESKDDFNINVNVNVVDVFTDF